MKKWIKSTAKPTWAIRYISEIISDAEPNTSRGVLYTSLSFAFSGKAHEFKTHLKRQLREKLDYKEYGLDGAGEIAEAYRERSPAICVIG